MAGGTTGGVVGSTVVVGADPAPPAVVGPPLFVVLSATTVTSRITRAAAPDHPEHKAAPSGRGGSGVGRWYGDWWAAGCCARDCVVEGRWVECCGGPDARGGVGVPAGGAVFREEVVAPSRSASSQRPAVGRRSGTGSKPLMIAATRAGGALRKRWWEKSAWWMARMSAGGASPKSAKYPSAAKP